MAEYQQNIPLTAFLGYAGLAAGTTTTTSTTASAMTYAIRGKAYTVTGAANGTTPTTDAVTGAAFTAIGLNKAGVFVFGYNAAGTLQCIQGEIVNYTDAGAFERAPNFPALPADFCPAGYELVKVISTGSSWTMGVSNQASQTGITKVFQNCVTLPSRPQVS